MDKVYLIYDSKVEDWSPPMVNKSVGEATRDLADIIADRKGKLGAHPEDFTLFEIGEYDNAKGQLHLYEAKKMICLLLDLRPKETQLPLQAVN